MTTVATPAQYDILIIRGAQTEAEKVQQQLGLKFNWLAVPSQWQEMDKALMENPISVVIIAGGKRDLVYECIRYAEELKPEAGIFVVSVAPQLLADLVSQLPQATFFDASINRGDTHGFFDFDQFIGRVKAEIIH